MTSSPSRLLLSPQFLSSFLVCLLTSSLVYTSCSSPTVPPALAVPPGPLACCFFIDGKEYVGAICLGMEEGENGANTKQTDFELVLLLH